MPGRTKIVLEDDGFFEGRGTQLLLVSLVAIAIIVAVFMHPWTSAVPSRQELSAKVLVVAKTYCKSQDSVGKTRASPGVRFDYAKLVLGAWVAYVTGFNQTAPALRKSWKDPAVLRQQVVRQNCLAAKHLLVSLS